MTRASRVLRAALIAGLSATLAVLVGDQGYWIAIPAALVLASAEHTTRAALLAAGLVLAATAAAAPPPQLAQAVLVSGLSVAVLVLLRLRLEREHDRLRGYAMRDPLTGLANRRVLEERLAYELVRHTRSGEPLVVLVLDLDGFKSINDRFGHDAGDEVLMDVADALLDAVREQDTVVRLGGDEFCVLAPQTGRSGAAHLTERIDDALARVTSAVSGMGASVGAAIFPADGETGAQLLAVADAAALAAKRRRRGERPAARRRAA